MIGRETDEQASPAEDPPRDLSAGHTPTPWEVQEIETQGGGGERYISYGVAGQNGKIVMDAINSSVAELHWEDDGEPAGHVLHWDDQGKRDAAFIVKAVNNHADLVKALTDLRLTARVLLQNAEGCAVNHYGHDFQTHGEPGWLRDSRLRIEAAEGSLAKLSEGLPTPQPRSTSHATKSSITKE